MGTTYTFSKNVLSTSTIGATALPHNTYIYTYNILGAYQASASHKHMRRMEKSEKNCMLFSRKCPNNAHEIFLFVSRSNPPPKKKQLRVQYLPWCMEIRYIKIDKPTEKKLVLINSVYEPLSKQKIISCQAK